METYLFYQIYLNYFCFNITQNILLRSPLIKIGSFSIFQTFLLGITCKCWVMQIKNVGLGSNWLLNLTPAASSPLLLKSMLHPLNMFLKNLNGHISIFLRDAHWRLYSENVSKMAAFTWINYLQWDLLNLWLKRQL